MVIEHASFTDYEIAEYRRDGPLTFTVELLASKEDNPPEYDGASSVSLCYLG
jgi:hypothetical protein